MDPDCVISNHRDSNHVGSCQLTVCWVDFTDSIAAGHFDFNRLYSNTVNEVSWCLQITIRSDILGGMNNGVSDELEWVGARFIWQNWDSLISLMAHVVWKLAKTHPSGPCRYNAVTAITRSISWTPKTTLKWHLTVYNMNIVNYYCFICQFWIIYFVTCLELFWSVMR